MGGIRVPILGVLNAVLPILGPAALDLRPSQVTIVVRAWASGQVGEPNPTPGQPDFTIVSSLALPQIYEVSQKKTQEVSGSGGEYELGMLVIPGIIPADPGNPGSANAFYPTQLAPILVPGQELVYVVTGPHNGEYALLELKTDDPFAYDLILTRRITTPLVTLPDVVAGESQ